MVTSSKQTYAKPTPRAPVPVADHCQPIPPQEMFKHSSVSVSVGSLGPGAQKVCLSPLSISAGMGFDSKCKFAPPTVWLGLLCRGPAPAGSKGTLRMDGIGKRDDTGLIMDWNLMVWGQMISEKRRKNKEERKRLIFLDLHRKPIKPLTRDLLCSRRPQAPSQWSEDAECLLNWVLEARAKR